MAGQGDVDTVYLYSILGQGNAANPMARIDREDRLRKPHASLIWYDPVFIRYLGEGREENCGRCCSGLAYRVCWTCG